MTGARPLYIHIGLQKTGTSYLQSIFWASSHAVHDQGVAMVPGSKRETFHLMLQVRGRYNPRLDPPEVATALERLREQLRACSGTAALITEESLAPARVDQIETLLEAAADREVHVVVTARDIGRQVPSAWQQHLKSGGSTTVEAYLNAIIDGQSRPARQFWANQNLLDVLGRWQRGGVAADRIHVVTVPPAGSPKNLLLDRFCGVLDIDPRSLSTDAYRGNDSLGRAQAELLRKVNAELPRELRRRQTYGDVGKRFFAIGVLGEQAGERFLLPGSYQRWCDEQAEAVVSGLQEGGFRISGDLDDLRSRPEAFGPEDLHVEPDLVLDSATAAIATMLGRRMSQGMSGAGAEGRTSPRTARPEPRSGRLRRLGRLR